MTVKRFLACLAAAHVAALLVHGAAFAAPPPDVAAAFKRIFPGKEMTRVRPANPALPGIYEVVSRGDVFYMSGDGRFLFAGQVMDTRSGRNLTEETLRQLRLAELKRIEKKRMLVYEPKGYDHTIYVFTDIDCGYCRQFHSQMPQLQALGVRVYYLMTSMIGGSHSRAKAVSVWCSDDRNAAMDQAKRGEFIPPKLCDNPVGEHEAFADFVTLRGTPAVLLESGTLLRGYLPPAVLLKELQADKARM